MLWQCLKMALKAIGSNKVRAFLTMLGIIIGVVALVVLVSLAESAQSVVNDELSTLGTNMLSVSVKAGASDSLKLSDLNEFMDTEELGLVAPIRQSVFSVRVGHADRHAIVYGTTAAYAGIQNLRVAYGRFLKTSDIQNNLYVAVLDNEAAKTLYGNAYAAVGKSLILGGMEYAVVGVLEESDSMMTSMMSVMTGGILTVYVPYSTMCRVEGTGQSVSSFYAAAPEPSGLDNAEYTLNRLMLRHFRQDEDAFTITNVSSLMGVMNTITSIFNILLGGIAGISLLVGGIGIMNIMLVSVSERTREIGIRKAIGANHFGIMMQFLIEALMLSVMGCLIGILVSWGILSIVNLFSGEYITFRLSFGVVALSVLFAIAIGVIFGLYPAQKAARMHPIDALRYE